MWEVSPLSQIRNSLDIAADEERSGVRAFGGFRLRRIPVPPNSRTAEQPNAASSGRRQRESKGGAETRLALHHHAAAVGLDDLLCHGQADAHAPEVPREGSIHLVEPLEDPALVFRRDADAG